MGQLGLTFGQRIERPMLQQKTPPESDDDLEQHRHFHLLGIGLAYFDREVGHAVGPLPEPSHSVALHLLSTFSVLADEVLAAVGYRLDQPVPDRLAVYPGHKVLLLLDA